MADRSDTPYRTSASIELCGVCREVAVKRCDGCNAQHCETHAAFCVECASRQWARQRRFTTRLAVGAVVLSTPLLVADVLASMAGWTAILLPPIAVAIFVAIFAIPAVVKILSPASVYKSLPAAPSRPLPPAPVASEIECESCAASSGRCSRCAAPRCADHSSKWSFYSSPVLQCREATRCHPTSRVSKRRRVPARRQNAKTIYSTVDA